MKTPEKKITPDEMVLQVKAFSKEEALDFLYRAGIVTQKGNYRKFYRSSSQTETTNENSESQSVPKRIVSPEEVIKEYKFEVKTKEEALNFLYRAGIVTKKGNLRKFYRNSTKSKTKAE